MTLCVKCAQYETTCCQACKIFVTDGDIQRIRDHVGHADFWEYSDPGDPDMVKPQPQDPNWLLYTLRPDGTRPHLKQRLSGSCTFLSSSGCVLPSGVRPLICRLYPYDYTEDGITRTVTGCPIYLLEKGQNIIDGLGMKHADAERWRAQLYHELRSGSVYDENRHHV